MQYLAAMSLLIVFVINILTPPAFVIDMLYVCSIVLVFRQDTKTILGFSAAAGALILINALFIDTAIEHSMSLWINRLISLVAIGITSYIAIHYRRQTQAAALKKLEQEQRYITELEAMLFMMSHQVRKPVANILGLIDLLCVHRGDFSEDETEQLCAYLQSSAAEFDTFIGALNAFIERTGQEHSPVPPCP
jgi:signal transduction histidine kinase